VIEGEQRDKKDKTRNDRIIAIEQANHSFADIKALDDLGNKFCDELQEFFVNYHRLEGKEYRVLARRGPGEARKLIKAAMK
jgi:inorganic pyrophosphatase